MQVSRRTNFDRSQMTTEGLILAARELFVQHGFVGTSTPAIVDRANVTRGALYHHFPDKQAVFRAVVEREAREVALAIAEREKKAEAQNSLELLQDGADAYLDAMAVDGRTRLLLVEGPAVLGKAAMEEIEKQHAAGSLREGLAALCAENEEVPHSVDLDAAVDLLSAAFDRAALAMSAGKASEPYRRAIKKMLQSFAGLTCSSTDERTSG